MKYGKCIKARYTNKRKQRAMQYGLLYKDKRGSYKLTLLGKYAISYYNRKIINDTIISGTVKGLLDLPQFCFTIEFTGSYD